MLRLIALDETGPREPLALAVGQRLGRHPRCELSIDHPSISRLHARVVEREGGLALVDADSRNGLWCGGERVEEIALRPGVELAVGGVEFKVEAGEPGGAAPDLDDEVLDEELEFDADLDQAVEGRPAAGTPAGGADVGLELEEEIELGAGGGAGRPGAAPPRGPGAEAPAASDAGAAARAAAAERRAELMAQVAEERRGLLRGELTQYPAWVQGLVWIAVLALFGGVAWLALRLVSG